MVPTTTFTPAVGLWSCCATAGEKGERCSGRGRWNQETSVWGGKEVKGEMASYFTWKWSLAVIIDVSPFSAFVTWFSHSSSTTESFWTLAFSELRWRAWWIIACTQLGRASSSPGSVSMAGVGWLRMDLGCRMERVLNYKFATWNVSLKTRNGFRWSWEILVPPVCAVCFVIRVPDWTQNRSVSTVIRFPPRARCT